MNFFRQISKIFPVVALILWQATSLAAAVTFTISPSTVSNTFFGPITLTINGISTGDTVVIQKYLDTDSNSIVDKSAILVQQFNLTDNQPGQMIIDPYTGDAVTNYNVPGDLNPANAVITASLNFQAGDIAQNLVGKYLYVLSSPVAHFTPLTNAFTVTNFPFAQKFTGNVVSNSTSTTLSNAMVILFLPPGSGQSGLGQPVAGTVANHSGAYTIAMPAGTYTLVSFYTNFAANLQNAPVVTLGSGLTVSTNLTLTNCTGNISGQLLDSTFTGLPGVFMPIESTNGMLTAFNTDSNGDFRVGVTPGWWSIGSNDSGLIVHGDVGLQNGESIDSGYQGLEIFFQVATALFYGSFKDSLGHPMVGFDISAENSGENFYPADGYTDTNGNYYVDVYGNLGIDAPWNVSVNANSSVSLTNYLISRPTFDQNGGTNIASYTATLVNFTALLATNTISGTVTNAFNDPIANVQVYADQTIGGVSYQSEAITSSSGNYSMKIGNGTWSLNVLCGGGQDSLMNYVCPNSITVAISNNNVTTNFVVQFCGTTTIDTPTNLPYSEANAYYSQTLQASSCYPPFTWQLALDGSSLPPGLSLSTDGTISGTPTTPGDYTFNVEVNDGRNGFDYQSYSLTISNGVQITTTSLPTGTNGLGYNQQLQAVSGQTPYGWVISSGSLPPGLSLDSDGLISGDAETNGIFNFTAAVTDNLGSIVFQPFTLILINSNSPPVAISTVGGQVYVMWPQAPGAGYTLQMTDNLTNGTWVPANGTVQSAFAFTNSGSAEFFRLAPQQP
ncbi:MAG TPA: putative Ig domain-containing protein [Verrucomicrobiae bacterium]|jgi:hypothetical protein